MKVVLCKAKVPNMRKIQMPKAASVQTSEAYTQKVAPIVHWKVMTATHIKARHKSGLPMSMKSPIDNMHTPMME